LIVKTGLKERLGILLLAFSFAREVFREMVQRKGNCNREKSKNDGSNVLGRWYPTGGNMDK
jgi:hypothetical protein